MSDIHPHWQSTEEDVPVTVKVSAAQKPAAPVASTVIPRGKRGPGAFAGIAVFFAIGIAFAQGIGGLLGQTSQQETIVSIDSTGTTPAIVTVKAGETITWENNDDIPHILQSDSLPTADNKPFETSAIFPDATYSYKIPANAAAGTYDYISQTAEDISGQIMIVSAAPTAGTTSSTMQTAFPQLPTMSGQMSSESGATFTEEEQSFPTGVIPSNPHTVGSPNANIPPRQQPIANTAGSVTKHAPVSHTQTGSGVFIVIAGSLAALGYITRKAFRAA